jgi:uncharacterized membrane protein
MAGANEGYAHPRIRRIGVADLLDALRLGFADFAAKPSHLIFLVLIYPIAGVVLAAWVAGNNMLPMLFPLMSGFALLGPIAAIGLYEISRQREKGVEPSWKTALDVRHSPAMPSIIAVGAMLFALFIAWLLVARALYVALYGDIAPASMASFVHDVLTTERGWMLMLAGNAIGFCFAVVVLATTVVAFPMLLDRDCGAAAAVHTSMRAVAANPVTMAVWGLIVAASLVIGSIPIFVGLAIVLPVLGHATWHLYRKVVE